MESGLFLTRGHFFVMIPYQQVMNLLLPQILWEVPGYLNFFDSLIELNQIPGFFFYTILNRPSEQGWVHIGNITTGREIMPKTRLNISLDQDLVDFVKVYVRENRTTVADVITQFVLALKRHVQGHSMEIILSDPDFHKALLDVQSRLSDGTAKWHTFEEVFGD